MKIKGFTPVFDSLVNKYDQSVAVTYGKIWRYCMWSDLNRCTVSNERLAKETGYGEKSIRRAKEVLAKDGLIERHYTKGKTDVCYVKHDLVLEMNGPDTSDIVSTDLGHDVHGSADIVSTKDSSKDSKEDILTGTLKFQREPDTLAGYPVDVVGLLTVYVKIAQHRPIKADKSDWIKTAREWKEMGVTKHDVPNMYGYAIEKWDVARPGSITNAYQMMKSKKFAQGKAIEEQYLKAD